MGSKSSSATSSTNTTKDTTINNVDNRVAEGDGSIGGNINVNFSDLQTGSGSTLGGGGGDITANITTGDFGALDTAKNIAEDAFNFSNSALGSIGGTVQALRDTASDSVKVAESAARDESARTMQFAILGVIIVGGLFVLAPTIKKVIK